MSTISPSRIRQLLVRCIHFPILEASAHCSRYSVHLRLSLEQVIFDIHICMMSSVKKPFVNMSSPRSSRDSVSFADEPLMQDVKHHGIPDTWSEETLHRHKATSRVWKARKILKVFSIATPWCFYSVFLHLIGSSIKSEDQVIPCFLSSPIVSYLSFPN
jgi:hypothetical protein